MAEITFKFCANCGSGRSRKFFKRSFVPGWLCWACAVDPSTESFRGKPEGEIRKMALPHTWFNTPLYDPVTERTLALAREQINLLQKEMHRALMCAVPSYVLVPAVKTPDEKLSELFDLDAEILRRTQQLTTPTWTMHPQQGDTKAGTTLATGGPQMGISAGSEWRDGKQQQMIQEAPVRLENKLDDYRQMRAAAEAAEKMKAAAPQRATVNYAGDTWNRQDLANLQELFAKPLPVFQNGDLVSWANGFEGIVIKSGHIANLLDKQTGLLPPTRTRVICTKGGMRGCSYSPLTESLVKL